jgi:hypothetical protein
MSVLTEYIEAKNRFYEHFKYDGFAYGIEDDTEAYWKIVGKEVQYAEEDWGDDEVQYSNDVRGVYRSDDLTMILVKSCTGDEYFQIFDNSKELK